MTKIEKLKEWFVTGAKPLQEQFWEWMDSYWHKNEKIPILSIENLQKTLNDIADNIQTAQTTINNLPSEYAKLSDLQSVQTTISELSTNMQSVQTIIDTLPSEYAKLSDLQNIQTIIDTLPSEYVKNSDFETHKTEFNNRMGQVEMMLQDKFQQIETNLTEINNYMVGVSDELNGFKQYAEQQFMSVFMRLDEIERQIGNGGGAYQ